MVSEPAERAAPARWALPAVAALAVVAALLLALGEYTDIDAWLADAMFDRARGEFVWRHAWLAEVVLHDGLRRLLIAVGIGLIGATLLDAWRPFRQLDRVDRLRLRVVALCAVAIPLTVATMKALSFSHCPWDLVRYGGAAVYVRLLEAAPAGAAPGRCFPAGHATSALWLAGLAVLWLPHAPKKALAAGLAGIGAGIALGVVQQARGAHFFSHTLWSAWIAVAIVVATVLWFEQRCQATGWPQSTRRSRANPTLVTCAPAPAGKADDPALAARTTG